MATQTEPLKVEDVRVLRDEDGRLRRVVLVCGDGTEVELPVTDVSYSSSAADPCGHIQLGVHGRRVQFLELPPSG